jgi:hypothetical protein
VVVDGLLMLTVAALTIVDIQHLNAKKTDLVFVSQQTLKTKTKQINKNLKLKLEK